MERYRLNRSPHSTHAVVAALVGQARTVLDVGCNRGYLRQICSPECSFWGVDADADALEHARRTYEDVRQVDLDQPPQRWWSHDFDAIVFGDVLEHLRDPAPVLAGIVRAQLARDGHVIVSLPNVANWRIRLQLLFGSFRYEETGILDRTHLRFFTFRSAREMIEASGLRIVEVHAGSSVFGGILRVLPALRGLLATTAIFSCRIDRTGAG